MTASSVLPLQRRGRARFDSEAEALLYDALIRRQEQLPRYRTLGIAVHPLVRVIGRTFTPDFMLTHDGHTLAIEVDGPHHTHRWAADRSRDELLEDCGLRVQRITVEDLTQPGDLEQWVDRTLWRLLGADINLRQENNRE